MLTTVVNYRDLVVLLLVFQTEVCKLNSVNLRLNEHFKLINFV